MMTKTIQVNRNLISGSISFIILFASLLMISGCGGKTADKTEDEQITESSVQLNNGTKWQANPETTTGINNMIQILSDFQEGENASDYVMLKKNLEAEFTMIFEKCTMTGDAHDQLHNYLMPLKDLLAKLESSDAIVSSTVVADTDEHLQLYGEYFE
jgi:hypothetical protein